MTARSRSSPSPRPWSTRCSPTCWACGAICGRTATTSPATQRRSWRRSSTPRHTPSESRARPLTTFLGLDIGTSAVKAVLVDEAQLLLADAEVPLAVSRPQPLWSEQDPADWWKATEAALGQLRAAAPGPYRGGAGAGAVGADARGGPAGRRRPGSAPGDLVERRACPRRVPGARRPRARPWPGRRRAGHAGLHRTQAALARGPRARRSRRASRGCCCPRITCACD